MTAIRLILLSAAGLLSANGLAISMVLFEIEPLTGVLFCVLSVSLAYVTWSALYPEPK